MPLGVLQHFTIEPSDLERTKTFYCDVLGLEDGDRPPLGFPGYWLYSGEVPTVHLLGKRTPREGIVVRGTKKKFKDTGRYEGFFGPDETNSVPANPQSATEPTPTQPEAAAEIINPLPSPVHPAANGGAPAEGSSPTEGNAPATAAPAAPENNNPAPVDAATAQQKAAAALSQKMLELNSGSTNSGH